MLGVLEKDPEDYLNSRRSSDNLEGITPGEIEALIDERNSARAEKNWERADEIRDELDSKGILLEDKADGTVWKVK